METLDATFMPSLLQLVLGITLQISGCQSLFGTPTFVVWGSCYENPKMLDNMNAFAYSGLWFDVENVPNEYQHTKMCVTQNYTWAGNSMNVSTKGLTESRQKVRQTAIMHVEKTSTPAHMTVIAEGVPEAPYQVIDTDYWHYSCVYSCLAFMGFKAEFMWIFSRTPSLDQRYISICYDRFMDIEVDTTKMVRVPQGEGCPYYEKLKVMLDENNVLLTRVLGARDNSSRSQTTVETSKPDENSLQDAHIEEEAFHNQVPLMYANQETVALDVEVNNALSNFRVNTLLTVLLGCCILLL